MDRRRAALTLLLLFLLCAGVAIVLSGSRPGLEQGMAPTVIAFVGYLFALVAGVLLLSPGPDAVDRTRTIGFTVVGALAVLVLVDLLAGGGPDIGAGFVRLIAEVLIVVATVRLALGVARARPVR